MSRDHPSKDEADQDSRDETSHNVPGKAAPSDYQSALLQIIETTSDDPRQVRKLVYELARINLKREGWQRKLTPSELSRCMLALETAITRVETDCTLGERTDDWFPRLDTDPDNLVGNEALPAIPDLSHVESMPTEEQKPASLHSWSNKTKTAPSPLSAVKRITQFRARRPETTDSGRLIVRTEPAPALGAAPSIARGQAPRVEIVYPEREPAESARVRRRLWLWFVVWPLIQLAGPAAFCLALYLAIDGRLDLQSVQTRAAIEQVQRPPVEAPPPSSGLPLPSTYGVYAVNGETLSELEPLPIKAPDARIQLSAELNKPSSTLLPDGKIVFIVFRRDLVNSAPQKVTVRVIARVARAMTLSSGKATTKNVESSWRIRANSYDFRVSPLNENREMVAIRPETSDFALPPGRYALVFGGLAYDFTVDGPITDPAQCLESFEATNGPVFTECRAK